MVASPTDGGLSQRLFDALIADYPDHRPGTRPVHAVGIGAVGYFVPSDVAPRFTVAEHFQMERVNVTVRFSNGSGSPVESDAAIDVRGMATKFHLPSGDSTDLVMSSLPVFFSRNPQDFLDLAKAGEPKPVKPQPRWSRLTDMLLLREPRPPADPSSPNSGTAGVIAYANCHPFARPAIIAALTQPAPTSYARATYHAIHTFKFTDPDGNVRYCRFAWEPVAGVRPETRSGLPKDYLHTELRQRLMRGPARFVLRAVVGGQGDALDNPTKGWDTTRLRVVMGELVLTQLAPDAGAAVEPLSFNPTRVVPGFDISNDKVLVARGAAYAYSCRQRGGTGC
ncbi:MAG: catalase [Acidimicrobiales bacterium]|nr:catalase [Acidimicrobiales bacterium]